MTMDQARLHLEAQRAELAQHGRLPEIEFVNVYLCEDGSWSIWWELVDRWLPLMANVDPPVGVPFNSSEVQAWFTPPVGLSDRVH